MDTGPGRPGPFASRFFLLGCMPINRRSPLCVDSHGRSRSRSRGPEALSPNGCADSLCGPVDDGAHLLQHGGLVGVT
jgi:hypothetical protein